MINMLHENYLDENQRCYLIDEYTNRASIIKDLLFDDEVSLEESFILELSFWWAAEDIFVSECYRYYISKSLIKKNFIYLLRDCCIHKMKKDRGIQENRKMGEREFDK